MWTDIRVWTAAAALVAAGCSERVAQTPPATETEPSWVALFEGEDWNVFPPGDAEVFHGVVRRVPADGAPTYVMRYNEYKLEDSRGSLTDIYTGSSDELLPFVDLQVELEGMLQIMDVEGTVFIEIWPSRIRLVPAGGEEQ
jgi:hypothetical protein